MDGWREMGGWVDGWMNDREKVGGMEDHVTPRRRCRLSLSLRSLCHIFYDPVSKI